MGTQVRILIDVEDELEAREAANAAFQRISRLEMVLSDYNPRSEVRLLEAAARGQPHQASPDLCSAMNRSLELSSRTGGAFDVTCGSLTRLWRAAFKTGQPPSDVELSKAMGSVGWEGVEVDEESGTITLLDEGTTIDFGGFGKGLAADAALAVLVEHGCARSLVDVGGDLAIGDPPRDRSGWTVGIALDEDEPTRKVIVANCGIATSGDAEQFLEHEGVRYSHVLDPRTGRALTTGYAVTVRAADATSADAYASALSVLGPRRGRRLAGTLPGLQVLSDTTMP